MRVPSTTHLFLVKAGDNARIADGASQVVLENHGVKYDTKVFLTELGDGQLGVGEDTFIPGERPVLRVPAGRTEAGAEIDERVARESFLPKRFRFGEDVFVACECPVGLLVAKRPERRQLGMAGQPGVLGHEHTRILRGYDKNVERGSAGVIFGEEFAVASGEVKRAERLMEVECPSGSADKPGDGHASAVCAELVAALTAAHRILRAAAVELRAAFAET